MKPKTDHTRGPLLPKIKSACAKCGFTGEGFRGRADYFPKLKCPKCGYEGVDIAGENHKASHTPGPWFAKVDNKNEKVDILTVDKPIKDDEENLRECIACVFDKANAAYIIKAANNFENMIEALKTTLECVDLSDNPSTKEVIEKAISQAEGRP